MCFAIVCDDSDIMYRAYCMVKIGVMFPLMEYPDLTALQPEKVWFFFIGEQLSELKGHVIIRDQ